MMHQGNWKCSGCGGEITELPFQPRSESGLTCRNCYGKSKGSDGAPAPEPAELGGEMPVATEAPDIPFDAGLAGEPAPAEDFGAETTPSTGEKPKFAGDWTCSGCKAAITSLPFEPRNTSNLSCIDCYKKSKA